MAENTGGSSRVGSIDIAGQEFTVTQGGAGCSYSILPERATFTPDGGTGTLQVSAAAGCEWTASAVDDWLTVMAGDTGSGEGEIGYSVLPNDSGVDRNGEIRVGGKAFTVTQGHAGCTYSITPTSETIGPEAGTVTLEVDTGSGCDWAWSSNASWLTADEVGPSYCVSAGTDSGDDVTFYVCVEENTGGSSRTGTINIAGQVFTVIQEGLPPIFSDGFESGSVSAWSTSVP